ncbi:CatA-like O-acetyltransferase [Providencia sp. Me31A]
MFTIEEFHCENEKILFPLAVQLQHAICDSFHVGGL